MATFSDDFNRANSTNLGADWTEQSGDWAVVSNQLDPPASTDNVAFWATDCDTTDHFAQVDVVADAGEQALLVRKSAVTTYYMGRYAYSVPGYQIYKRVSGTFSLLASDTGTSPGSGYTARFEVSGSSLTFKTDGTTKLTVTDTALTTGKGLGLRSNGADTATRYDNWSGGDLSTSTTLVVQDSAHAQTAGNLDLVQHHVLTVADAGHAQTAGALDLVQHHVLTVADDAAHAQTAGALDLVQHQVLVADDAAHAQTAGNVTLTAHAPGAALTIQDAAHAQTVGNLDLVQHHVLAVADAAHGHTADSPTLSTTAPVTLVVADAAHAHTAGNVALVQHHVLDVQDATHAHTSDLVVWVQAVTYGKVTARIPATAGVAAAAPARSTVTAVSNPVF